MYQVEHRVRDAGCADVDEVVDGVDGEDGPGPLFDRGCDVERGSMTSSLPQTAAKCTVAAMGARRPSTPRRVPQDVPYPQWTTLENLAAAPSARGSRPSTLRAASAGTVLGSRLRSRASAVLESVTAEVPMAPATRPLPSAAAKSPTLMVRVPC